MLKVIKRLFGGVIREQIAKRWTVLPAGRKPSLVVEVARRGKVDSITAAIIVDMVEGDIRAEALRAWDKV